LIRNRDQVVTSPSYPTIWSQSPYTAVMIVANSTEQIVGGYFSAP